MKWTPLCQSLRLRPRNCRAETRVKADQLIAELRKKRDEFQSTMKKQAEAGEAVWERIKVQLETEWKTFEADLKKYLEAVGQEIGQQQAVFEAQLAAQMKAWREAADKVQTAAGGIRGRATQGNRGLRIAHESRCCDC